MNVCVRSAALRGIEGTLVDVEVDITPGVGQFEIVGLPEATVKESRVRVVSTLRQMGFRATSRRVTVNLAPADIRKQGSFYDLPIALGILGCLEAYNPLALEGRMFLGELSLDGHVRPVPGVLPMVAQAASKGIKEVIVPKANGGEAALVEGIKCYGVETLAETVAFLSGAQVLEPSLPERSQADRSSLPDMIDVAGQAHAKRALEVAAAGGHNLLMIGPPGSGKTMLARRLPSILPDMSYEEALETTKVYSVAGLLRRRGGLITQRPFRAPHHTSSAVSLVGGGSFPRPGEVSLAHNGVLFLDELPEWRRDVVEVLRQPLEDGFVTITRACGAVSFPASFMLVAAMNPCPCGYFGDTRRRCTCSPAEVSRYRSRISGPLLDRIDIHIEVPAVPFRDLARPGRGGEPSSAVRKRVEMAREAQAKRFRGTNTRCNARMTVAQVNEFCAMPPEAIRLLEAAVERLGLSARAIDRIRKVARTIADLEGSEGIETVHVSEAIQYRLLDRTF